MSCNCMGPQDGEPLCPCQMATARRWLGLPDPVRPMDQQTKNLIAIQTYIDQQDQPSNDPISTAPFKHGA